MLVFSLMAGVTGYLACALLTARKAYGIERERIIAQESQWHADEDPLQRFRVYHQPSSATAAFVLGLAWPLVVPGYCLYRCAAFVITARPPVTRAERAHQAAAVQRRIQELETSLRLGERESAG